MKKTRFTERQVVQALNEYEGGKKAEAICRELGVTSATFYNWKKPRNGWTTTIITGPMNH